MNRMHIMFRFRILDWIEFQIYNSIEFFFFSLLAKKNFGAMSTEFLNYVRFRIVYTKAIPVLNKRSINNAQVC